MQQNNNNVQYQLKEIVWGKVCGYPWWPGIVTSINKKDYEVVFFYEFSKSFLKNKKIKKFEDFEPRNLESKPDLEIAYQQALEVINNKNTLENLIQERENNLQQNNIQEQRQLQETSESKTVTDSISKVDQNQIINQPQTRLKRYQSVQIIRDDKQLLQENKVDPIIKAIENNIQDLFTKIQNDEVNYKDDLILFQSVFETIMDQDNQKVYESQIGKYLKQLIDTVEIKVSQTNQFQRLLDTLKNGLQKVQKKLIEGFFNYRQMKSLNSIKRQKKIKKNKKVKIKKTQTVLKTKKNKNDIIKNTEEKKPKVEQKELKFKVKKKIAEILLKKINCPLTKQQTEELVEKLEQNLDQLSQNQEQYQESFLKLINNLQIKKHILLKQNFWKQDFSKIITELTNQKKLKILIKI